MKFGRNSLEELCGAVFNLVFLQFMLSVSFLGILSDLLKQGNAVSIHNKNRQAQATEMLEVKNNVALKIMNEFFASKVGQ